MKLYTWAKKQKWLLLGGLALGWAVAINHFPAGYIILGGDVLQPINLDEKFQFLYYEWFGRASLFYGFFYLLDISGVTSTGQLSWYVGVFLFGSYVSFLLFCRLLFPQTSQWLVAGMSLFYATNVYTLYVFTSTWGFTGYQILYVFIPVLTGLYMKALETRKSGFMFLFLVATFIASMSFGNPAFALSLGIYFFLLTVALFASRFTSFDLDATKRIGFLVVGVFLLNTYWILPLFPQLRSGITEVYTSEFVDLTERLRETSNTIYDTIRLLPTSEQNRYYPYNFPYVSLAWMKQIVFYLTFVPFFLVLVGWIQRKYQMKREKKLYAVFFSLFTVFIVLVARVRFPFETLNSFLFQLPGLNTLRGWDKMAILTPFLLSVLLLLSLGVLQRKKYFLGVFVAFGFVAFLLVLPFYAGGIQTELSYILSGNKKKDFRTANYSALVKIPEPYHALADTFRNDMSESKVTMLPFSAGSSVGRVNLPEWKVNGPHPAHALYVKKYIELNDYYLGKWLFAKEFEKSEYNPEWIMDLFGLIGIEYILYHHDAKPKSLEKFELARQYLEEEGAIHPLTKNDSFTLYRIDKQYLFPRVYTNPDALVLEPRVNGLSEKVHIFRDTLAPMRYERVNAKEMTVSVESLASDQFIFLNEQYDPLWRAEYVSPAGKRSLLKRNDSVKYANAWKVDKIDPTGKIDIYYIPVRLLYIGEWMSGLTLLGVVFGAGWMLRRERLISNETMYGAE